MKTYKRADRVKQLLQQEISRILQFDIKDPRISFVTVTTVKLTTDLREAKVFVSSLDSSLDQQEILEGLTQATGFIRGDLGRTLKLKYIPHLEFVWDDSYDKQERILNLLDQIKQEEQESEDEEE